ncbi:MAG: PAS domain S-box protein, partial [Anaerolineae bacterium]|nr:PAS domain S-box protein [Anaerolineae bacterium]
TGHALSTVLDINDLLALIGERVTTLFASDVFVLFQLDADGATLRPILALGPSAENVMRITMRRDQGLTALVFETGEPLLINEAHDDPRAHKIPNEQNRMLEAHVLIAPLVVRGRIIGTMVLNRIPGNPFTATDLRVFTGFVHQVAAALDNVRLYTELEQRVKERTVELEQRTHEVESILRSVADGIMITNYEGVIVSVNPAFEQMTGFGADELADRNSRTMPFSKYLGAEHIEAMWDQVRVHGTLRADLPIQRRDGTMFDGDLSVSALRDDAGSMRGFVVVIHDVTALKEVQRMKDAFVSNVTHELRTPITNLKLRQDLIEARPERTSQHLPVIQRETDRLSRIIDDLLMLSRIDQDRTTLDMQWVDLSPLVEEYVTDRTSLAEARGLSLSSDTALSLPRINADAGLLGQALSIILTNALDYTPAGGAVAVSTVRCVRDNGSWVGIEIRDTGRGISAEDRTQLFSRFFRGAAGRESGVSGTGLGLAIAQEIVQRHNGWIQVESTGVAGEGATFTIWLPDVG